MEYIKGKNLTEVYYQYSSEEKQNINQHIARILQDIHSIDI